MAVTRSRGEGSGKTCFASSYRIEQTNFRCFPKPKVTTSGRGMGGPREVLDGD